MDDAKQILIFGEVLIDRFDNGIERRGGAPFNVAWHLRGFGEDPLFISRVGMDQDGRQLLEDMTNWNLQTVGIQLDDEKPTGYVSVFNQMTNPTFEIHTEVAYDFIDPALLDQPILQNEYELIYHGSLALRKPLSKSSFDTIINKHDKLPVFFDINLRPPWWNIELVEHYLHRTTILKCNVSELMSLAEHYYPQGVDSITASQKLLKSFKLESVIVTLGEDGAFLCDHESNLCQLAPEKINKVINSVGAGDAFSAVMILGKIHNWSPYLSIQRANIFAASICQIEGAVPDSIDFYEQFLDDWDKYGNK